MNDQKLLFLTHTVQLVKNIDPLQKPLWGKMNVQQMIEHIAKFFEISSGKRKYPLITPEAHLPKFREFLLSEKPFRENTKAPVLPDEPEPVTYPFFGDSLDFLQKEIEDFISYYENDPQLTMQHPVFGNLNFPEWVQLHHKHVTHHLRQFGVTNLNSQL